MIYYIVFPILRRRPKIKKVICKFWVIGLVLYLIETLLLVDFFSWGLDDWIANPTLATPIYLSTLAIDVALMLNLMFSKKKLNSTFIFLTTFFVLIVLCSLLFQSLLRESGSRISWYPYDYLVSLAAFGLCCLLVGAIQVKIFKNRLDDFENPIKAGDCFYHALASKMDALIKLPLLVRSILFVKKTEQITPE